VWQRFVLVEVERALRLRVAAEILGERSKRRPIDRIVLRSFARTLRSEVGSFAR